MRTPAFRISAGGADVTRIVEQHLVRLRLSSTSDRTSDTLELEISDSNNRLAAPTTERELKVSLGYRDSRLVDMGVYFHSESEIQLAPARLIVRATAADFRSRSSLKAPKRRSWDDVALGSLVRAIAAEHGYTARVHSRLAGIVIPHIDQTAESDLHLLRRLARQYDATTKALAGHLIFEPRGIGRSAGTDQALPIVVYAPGQRAADGQSVLSARYTVKGRPRYSSVVATYQDVAAGKLAHVKAGGGEPTYQIREPFPDRPQAEDAARARLTRLSRQTEELELQVPGNPLLVSEAVIALEQWPSPEGSRWTVLRADHSLSKKRGYVTDVTAEPLQQS